MEGASTAVTLDRARCMGSTMCSQIAPDAFGIDESGTAFVRPDHGTSVQLLIAAEEQCPVNAIAVVFDN